MKYKLVLELELGQASVYLTDRYNKELAIEPQHTNNITVITTDIELPNKIKVHIRDTIPVPAIKLLGVSLGHIRFNKHSLGNLFVYYHPYGNNRTTTWEYGGLAEFEFFEHSAIKHHLVVGTVI